MFCYLFCIEAAVTDESVQGQPRENASIPQTLFLFPRSDQAAADASRVKELESILAEARSLEVHLKERKHNLREKLGAISDKLG